MHREIGTSRIFFSKKNNYFKTCAVFLYNTSLSLQQKTKTMSIFSGYKPLHFAEVQASSPGLANSSPIFHEVCKMDGETI